MKTPKCFFKVIEFRTGREVFVNAYNVTKIREGTLETKEGVEKYTYIGLGEDCVYAVESLECIANKIDAFFNEEAKE